MKKNQQEFDFMLSLSHYLVPSVFRVLILSDDFDRIYSVQEAEAIFCYFIYLFIKNWEGGGGSNIGLMTRGMALFVAKCQGATNCGEHILLGF